MLLLRVVLPNRPGALGAVASAVGEIGANINLVGIVENATMSRLMSSFSTCPLSSLSSPWWPPATASQGSRSYGC